MKNIEMKVTLYCSVCANDQFSSVDESITDLLHAPDEIELKCSDCGRVATKGQIIEENSHVIDANLQDLKKEAIKQLEKEFKKIFK